MVHLVAPSETRGLTREYLTAEEVATIIGMSQKWVYKEAREGTLPAIKVGRRVRFRKASVEQWMKDNENST